MLIKAGRIYGWPFCIYLYNVIRTPAYSIQRTPHAPVDRRPGMRLTRDLFCKLFAQEIDLRRDQVPKTQELNAGRPPSARYAGLIKIVAKEILEVAKQLNVDPINVAFIYLNRYYPVFARGAAMTTLRTNWDDFVMELETSIDLPRLLKYTVQERRRLVQVIKDLPTCVKSKRFQNFMKRTSPGFTLKLPPHTHPRSRMFETLLIMYDQLKKHEMTYYLESNITEVLKAHVAGLKKHGDPIKLHLGNFIGANALHRLRNYMKTKTSTTPEKPGRKVLLDG